MTRHCKLCDTEIPAARLEALPDTQVCMKCSEKIGGEWDMVAVPGSINKATSIKKNYGSFYLVKTRRML
jgi:RNA polymerase-binding transcription factor DksA